MGTLSARLRKFLKSLGPGLITGASDDDPSGITTYTIAGAQFGFQTLWTVLLTFPLMAAVQEMCARIGLVTEHGLVGTMRRHYPKGILFSLAAAMFVASTINIGSDIGGMAAAAQLLAPTIPFSVFAIVLTALIVGLVIYLPYQSIARVLKWLTLALLAYIVAAFATDTHWRETLVATVVPRVQFSQDFLMVLVGIFGTTISPYLFFWQASEEAEEEHEKHRAKPSVFVKRREIRVMEEDVVAGMFFSNLVMYFIIATAASTLWQVGIHDITTAEEAAAALEPLAGPFAKWLFAAGLVGTGLLAIPVLAGAAAYAMAEAFGWREGLDREFGQAKRFYLVIILAGIFGLALNFLGVNPFSMLFWTAVLYGLLSPIMIAVILHISNNRAIMGKFKNSPLSNILGGLTLLIMTAAAVALVWTLVLSDK